MATLGKSLPTSWTCSGSKNNKVIQGDADDLTGFEPMFYGARRVTGGRGDPSVAGSNPGGDG